MSTQLLRELNGRACGPFYHWLAHRKNAPHIAWYPSAGADFRDLLHLNERFAKPVAGEPPAPELFLHTDYYCSGVPSFLEGSYLYQDARTAISILTKEELPPLNIPLDRDIVHFPSGSVVTGRVVFFEVEVVSCLLGSFTTAILYVFAENAAFCALKMLPNHARVSHIVHVRYGQGFGGSHASGSWLLNTLRALRCKVFISDPHLHSSSGDLRVHELYPKLAGPEETDLLREIRVVPESRWSNHGDVSWYLVTR
jgi:hypothetical protein